MMKILKASAGSGKTYRLAKTYITLLLENRDRYAYRHILAVTFTNKATAEMKSRILSELHTLAQSPESSSYYPDFVPALFPNAAALGKRAGDVLVSILHDYSAFAVSTIDRFFQQTLKAFSREIGQFASYQVELDRKSLINEAVDRVLDSLTEDDKELIDWLDKCVAARIGDGKRANLEETLYSVALKLKSDVHRDKLEEYGLKDADMFSKGRLDEIYKECLATIEAFEKQVVGVAEHLCEALSSVGVNPKDSNRKFMDSIVSYSCDMVRPLKKPSPSVLLKAADKDQWFAKKKANLLDRVDGVLDEPLNEFCYLFDRPYKVYMTAILLKDNIYSLGMAREFYNSFDALLKEKNVLGLDDSNEILRGIIDGSDAPFVYEKLGVRYEHFLLDEFQDTSSIQWQNFLPLLRESDSNGSDNLVVGDVKQCIYRWRGSDWQLLAHKLKEQFPLASEEVLGANYRSARAIVEFNNGFFNYAADMLGVNAQYSDVSQRVAVSEQQEGYVCVDFVPADDEPAAVLASINDAMSSGAEPGDIAILVRNNNEGSMLATFLIGNGIPVISDDSLDVKSSLTVRKLVSLLSFIDNPQDDIGGFVAQSSGLAMDSDLELGRHSLVDLCEELLRRMMLSEPQCMYGQTLFVQSFMDSVQEWTAVNGQNLQAFLKYWNDTTFSISSPSDSDSVRIMTIHKSKGLEFPYVIFPYAEKVALAVKGTNWCYLDAADTSIASASGSIYPVELSSSICDTLFEQDYLDEKCMHVMDSINVFYVALTRASRCLHIISATPPQNMLDSHPSADAVSNLSQLLYFYVKGKLSGSSCTFGSPYDFSKMKRKQSQWKTLESDYSSYPLGERLSFPTDAAEFFGENGVAGTAASSRLNGIVLHDILSSVSVPNDLSDAVADAVRNGHLAPAEAERDYVMLHKRINSAITRGWFPANGKVLTEASIIAENGTLHRPDRVVYSEDGVIVVDYKFGSPRAIYREQVLQYVELYRRMGYENVRGYLWYVYTDEVVEV